MAESLHSLDKRMTSLEEWRRTTSIELDSIRETIRNEITAHYTKRITESEARTMLQIGNLIDEKLEKKFGWIPRIMEGVFIAVVTVIILALVGLA